MSTNLKWAPVAPEEGEPLPIGLKWALRKRHNNSVDEELTEADLPYLVGLLHADCEGAQELIDAIEKFGIVRVWES